MAETFHLPRIGDAMSEGEIVEWFVAVGDAVELDQVICSIETDKSVVELTTPFRGTVLGLGGSSGDVLQVGDALLVVGEAGEAVPEIATAPATPATPTPMAAASAPAPAAPAASRPGPSTLAAPAAAPLTSPAVASPVSASSVPAADGGMGWGPNITSPVVRRLANAAGVDIERVAGSGVGGRVTRADIESAATSVGSVQATNTPNAPNAPNAVATASNAPNAVATSSTSPTDGRVRAMPKVRKLARDSAIDLSTIAGTGPGGAITAADLEMMLAAAPAGDQRQRLSAMRRSIAAHLTESAQTIPQFTSTIDVDATAVIATRQALRGRLDAPVPVDAVLMALMIPVLRDHPRMNARLDGDEIVYHGRFDIGVAVDTPDGLMVPVVTAADQRSIADLAGEIVRLAAAARERRIQPTELSGATCTLNNVGAVGIETGTPILPLGTSAIVAFGRTRPMVQLVNGNPVEVPTMTLCATFDHRLVDGGDSGRFLTQLKQHLEVPALGLL